MPPLTRHSPQGLPLRLAADLPLHLAADLPLRRAADLRLHRAALMLLLLASLTVSSPGPLHAQAPGDSAAALSPEQRAAELRATIQRLGPDGPPAELAEAYNALGLIHWTASRFESALAHLRHAHSLWTSIDDSVGLGRAYNNIGVTYYQWGHFEPALDAFGRSLELRRALGDVRGTSLVLSNIGVTYQDLRLYDRALPVLEAAVVAAHEAGGAAARGYALHALGMLQLHRGDLAAARSNLEASIAIYRTLDDPQLTRRDAASGWSLNAVALGLLHVREGDAAAGIALLEEVLAAAREANHARRQATALLYLGRAHRARGEPAVAIRRLEQSLAIATQAAQRMLALDALAELAAAHEERGDTRAALAYLRSHHALGDSIFNQNALQRIAVMETRVEAERQQVENARLREERQARDAVIARQRIAGALGGALLIVSAILVIALVHFNRTGRERQRLLQNANVALEDTNRELRAALSEVRTLKGLIPICSSCKKVRDDRGFWEAVETYISSRSDALFSHSICADCGPRLYGSDWPVPSTEAVATDGEPLNR